MLLQQSLKRIKDFILKKYGEDLAAIIVFGSANTGHFHEGKSDIDLIVLIKENLYGDLKAEATSLYEKLKSEHASVHSIETLQGIKERIRKEGSFSTYITLLAPDGSFALFSTQEFEKAKEYLEKHPLTKESIIKYLNEKDIFELEGYFKNESGFKLTKSFMAHIRRKLQIMNYFQNHALIFDYLKCLHAINLDENLKQSLKMLSRAYESRRHLTKEEIQKYYEIAQQMTNLISA